MASLHEGVAPNSVPRHKNGELGFGTSERAPAGGRSDQRPIEVVDALADLRGRSEPLMMALGRDLILSNSPKGP
jgi:hypothetical protein